jgi:hypothetical protein
LSVILSLSLTGRDRTIRIVKCQVCKGMHHFFRVDTAPTEAGQPSIAHFLSPPAKTQKQA